MKRLLALWLAGTAMALISCGSNPETPSGAPSPVALTTVAFRVHKMPEMVAFYSEAFGVRFRGVETYGIRSQFGELPGVTLKFVPIRDSVEFEQFPIHQPGFIVPDVERVVAVALRHGGRVESEPRSEGGRTIASVRDPDGNTIELYGR